MSTAIVEIEVPPEITADEFDVFVRRQGEDDEDWVHHGSSRSPRFTLDNLPSTGTLEIGVGWRLNGVLVPPERWTVLPYQASDPEEFEVPEDILLFGVGQEGGQLRFTWRAVEVMHLSHYEIRKLPAGGDWDDSLWIADVPAPNTTYVTGWMMSGAQIYSIKAVTKHGLKSETACDTSLTVRADDYYVLQTSTAEATAFSSTKVGCEVVSNKLRPTSLPASYADKSLAYTAYTQPWWYPTTSRPTYTTAWIDAGAVMDEKVEVNLAYDNQDVGTAYGLYLYPHDPETETLTGTSFGPGARRPGDLRNRDGTAVDGTRFRIEIGTAQDATPTDDGFRDWVPGTVYRFRQYRLKITWLNDWPFIRTQISTLTHRMLRRNLKDEQSVGLGGTGGTTVTWTTPFQVAPKVVATVISNLSLHATVDTITTTGCKVYVFDAGGTEQAVGTVHVIAAGV